MVGVALLDRLADLVDPRVERTRWHTLIDIVAVTVCAVICGADNWVDVALFGRSKEAWLRQWVELGHGIPSHDTFGRVFAMLDPEAFAGCFRGWMSSVQEATKSQVVAIDGKTVRGSGDRARGEAAIHLASAWASSNHLVLGQVKVDDRSNEIAAMSELLRLLSLTSCTVTIDAMGYQFQDVPHSYGHSLNKEHGRIETRECWAIWRRQNSGLDW